MPASTLPFASPAAARPAPWLGGNMPVARLGLILNLIVPLALLAWDGAHRNLGADPVNDALHTTGLVAITYLLFSLAVTPLRMVTGWSWLVQFRRSLGVYAFYYACAHLAIYYWWDRGQNVQSTIYEITHRYYLLIGFISLVLMAPLWATSFNGAIRALGATGWKRLHRLAYLAAALGCWHLYLQSKADKRRPDVYIALLIGLLLWRVAADLLRRRREAVRADAPVRGESPVAGAALERPVLDPVTPVAAVAEEVSTGPEEKTGTAQVTFAQSGRTVPLPPGTTVLEAAEAAGVTIDYQCRAGVCGTCRCKLLRGEVTMETRDALSDEEEREGYILACQAHAIHDITIEA